MTQQKYLRFTVLPHDGKQSTEEGIFVAAYELANGDNLDQTARDFLRELLTWFREHLPVPERFNVGGSKGKYRTDSRGLSWFKPSAHEHIAKSLFRKELSG